MYDDEFLGRLETRLRAALPEWGLAADAPVELLTISENATFRVEAGDRPLVFRVHRPAYHDAEEIASELAWLEALRRGDVVTTPEPLPRIDGELLGTIVDGAETRHVVAFSFMSGAEPQPGERLAGWYGALGEITAQLHAHARGWKTRDGFRRKTWDYDAIIGARPYWGDWRGAPGLDAEGEAVVGRAVALLRRQLEAYGVSSDRFGLIHADLRPANLLVDGDRLGVIDFDDCGFCWYFYDFAAAVSFMEHEPFIPELQEAWLSGYGKAAPVMREDAEMLPSLVLLRRIQLTAWIASHAETPTAQSMGDGFARGTVALAERHLMRFG
jgi:Ser/Thr protein kinase RdoA (MazF antagonist)